MLLQFKSSARKSGITLTACTTPSSRSPPSGSGTWWQVSLYHVHDSTYHVLLLLLAYFPRAYFPRAYFPCAYFPRDYQLLHAYYFPRSACIASSCVHFYVLARSQTNLLPCMRLPCAHVFYVTVLHPLRACLLCYCIASFACMSSIFLHEIHSMCARLQCSWIAYYGRMYSMFLDCILCAHVLYVLG